MKINALAYDAETARAIHDPKLAEKYPMIKSWATGWKDYIGMGIACVACYDFWEDRYHIFTPGSIGSFSSLVKQRKHIIGFYTSEFDDYLLQAHGINVKTTFDLLTEVRIAVGLTPKWTRSEAGNGRSYKLGRIAHLNLGYGKSGSGELAPILWQLGQQEDVKDYCIFDVKLMRDLMFKALANRTLYDPNTGESFQLSVEHLLE